MLLLPVLLTHYCSRQRFHAALSDHPIRRNMRGRSRTLISPPRGADFVPVPRASNSRIRPDGGKQNERLLPKRHVRYAPRYSTAHRKMVGNAQVYEGVPSRHGPPQVRRVRCARQLPIGGREGEKTKRGGRAGKSFVAACYNAKIRAYGPIGGMPHRKATNNVLPISPQKRLSEPTTDCAATPPRFGWLARYRASRAVFGKSAIAAFGCWCCWCCRRSWSGRDACLVASCTIRRSAKILRRSSAMHPN